MAIGRVGLFLAAASGLLCVYLTFLAITHSQEQEVVLHKRQSSKRVLVTGAAGFIGFHVAKHLQTANPDNLVVGLDNFNDYYDVQLKVDRAHELHQLGATMVHHDLCDVPFLEALFERYRFSHVVHMAAQAGVRYSLENPLAYVTANVQCSLALLDVLKKYTGIKLVYASSSSVYGKESSIPFRLSDDPDRPGNMYAATKRVDELVSYHYCAAHNLSAVGLRFFTVYGPWGRPDMAVYKFAQSILEGKEVPLFHVSDDAPLGRDFTYIDDVISGIAHALDYEPHQCGENFNIGFGDPVSVPGLVRVLERELDRPARVKKLPLPPTEILQTWADVTDSRIHLNFEPRTSLEEGVKHFVAWYKDYTQRRLEQGQNIESQRWFRSLLHEGQPSVPS